MRRAGTAVHSASSGVDGTLYKISIQAVTCMVRVGSYRCNLFS
jgi:hypothetical protein